MITFKTKSGSTYQVDEHNKMFRRVGGDVETYRCAWRSYESHQLHVGYPGVVVMDKDNVLYTSRVTEVSI